MEANQNNTGADSAKQSGAQSNFSGFDLNGLINNASFMEWLKPLLSGAGAMTGTYFMWIKPMQEKIDAMGLKLTEQEKQIRNLEDEIDEIESRINKPAHKPDTASENLKGTKEDYFEIKNRGERSGNFRKRRNLHL